MRFFGLAPPPYGRSAVTRDAGRPGGHDHFLKWIETEFGMSDWTARQFVNAVHAFGAKSEIISDLPPTVLYALAAPSTPDEVRNAVVEKAAAGEKVTSADVKGCRGRST